MGIVTIATHIEPHQGLFPVWDGDGYLGEQCEFTLCGHVMHGEIIEVEREYLCNGIHDIVTVEVAQERKQVKVSMHRQAVRILR